METEMEIELEEPYARTRKGLCLCSDPLLVERIEFHEHHREKESRC